MEKQRNFVAEEFYDVTQTTKTCLPPINTRKDKKNNLNKNVLYKHINKKELNVWGRGQCQQLALAKSSGKYDHNAVKDAVALALEFFGDLKLAFNFTDKEYDNFQIRKAGMY